MRPISIYTSLSFKLFALSHHQWFWVVRGPAGVDDDANSAGDRAKDLRVWRDAARSFVRPYIWGFRGAIRFARPYRFNVSKTFFCHTHDRCEDKPFPVRSIPAALEKAAEASFEAIRRGEPSQRDLMKAHGLVFLV